MSILGKILGKKDNDNSDQNPSGGTYTVEDTFRLNNSQDLIVVGQINGTVRTGDKVCIEGTSGNDQILIKELDIRCTSPAQSVGTLSGGNQQKVCVARALAMKPKFLFVSEPTRGIDIGAKQLVLETLVRLNREQGLTIVMVSSELQELRSICDRIAIVAEGKVVDILSPDASDIAFGLAMSGKKMEKGETV